MKSIKLNGKIVEEWNGNRKRIIAIASSAALAVALFCIALINVTELVVDRSANLQESVEFYVTPSTDFREVSEKVVPYLKWQRSFARKSASEGIDSKMKCGFYRFNKGTSTNYIVRSLKYGWQSPVKLVISPFNRTQGDLCRNLARYAMADSAQFSAAIENFIRFIPNTYEIYWSHSAGDIVHRLEHEWRKFWNGRPDFAGGATRGEMAKSIGLSPVEVTIIASIVCQESNWEPEYPRIAGVYVNRLKIGIPLQADPTVKFAVGDFSIKRILHKHLTVDSPYNTYRYAGLPPGPICLPSIAAIDAVLNYEKEQYLYFCANSNFDGTHLFAKSLAEHNRNGAAYRKALRKVEKEKKKREKQL